MIGIVADMLFVCSLKKAEIREFEEVDELTGQLNVQKATLSSLLNHMPALSFYKDAKSGVYLACNQAFAEYANKKSPAEVVGLTDYEIFDPLTARHFDDDDKKALSMEEPYIFFEDVPDATGNQKQFQTTNLLMYVNVILTEIRKSINPRQKSQIIDLVFKTSAAQPSVILIILFYRSHSRLRIPLNDRS